MERKKGDTCIKIHKWDFGGVNNDRSYSKHGELLPNSIRCLMCGPSGCGKTNVLLSLLLEPNGLKFLNVYLYSKSLQQPKYVFLNEILSKIDDLTFYQFHDKSEVVPPEEAKENSVVIFDDVALQDQDTVRQYFAMGRHKDLDCFYLCQTYSKIPKQLVRDNANLILLFKQDELNLRHAYNDHVNTDMTWDQFKGACETCWSDKHTFLTIDKEKDLKKGRYRKCFERTIIV